MIFRKHEKTEDVIKRKSYYGFAKYYPGKMGTKSSYVIGESRIVKKKERISHHLSYIWIILNLNNLNLKYRFKSYGNKVILLSSFVYFTHLTVLVKKSAMYCVSLGYSVSAVKIAVYTSQ